ncbi:hypothetical protein [Neisseria wadsworthii]|uniref:hypothetical protein n=1 Tax=Neisseria wadsworthii TaxID=607711 RepID=UPI00131D8C67|nr:hypothetical protein [Neisseria wadsworthii]
MDNMEKPCSTWDMSFVTVSAWGISWNWYQTKTSVHAAGPDCEISNQLKQHHLYLTTTFQTGQIPLSH